VLRNSYDNIDVRLYPGERTWEKIPIMIFFMRHILKGMELSCSMEMVVLVFAKTAELHLRTEVEGSCISDTPF
jgi:hypothetical protein